MIVFSCDRLLAAAATAATLWMAASADAQVRYEAEGTGTPSSASDMVAAVGATAIPRPGASGGVVLETTSNQARIRLLFRGTGVAVIAEASPLAGGFQWVLNDGAQTGTVSTTFGSTQSQSVFPIVPGGSLPDRLHTLEISPVIGPGEVLRIDAFDVQSDGARRRYELEVPYNARFTGSWVSPSTVDGAAAGASGGAVSRTLRADQSFEFRFAGRGVALLLPMREGARRIYWEIDGQHSGMIDPSAVSAGETRQRWPFVLRTDLANGPHRLVVRTGEGSIGEIDAIEVLPQTLPSVLPGPYWASIRGMMTFTSRTYLYPYNPREWTLPQWEAWLDQLAFLGINQVMLPRAPWSERPAQTPDETAREELWRQIFSAAKSRGMTTNVIFGSTYSGDPSFEWRLLSPNNPSHPHWQTLVSGYRHFAQRYGTLVDEWSTGVEDPGGCPICAGISYQFVTSTSSCSSLNPVCTVSDLVGLQDDLYTAVRQHNPSARVVAQTWGLQWFGRSPGFTTPEQEFISAQSLLPPDVVVDNPITTITDAQALVGTGRTLRAWPFFLIDHEFPAGHTRVLFDETRTYVETIRQQNLTSITPHVTHPIEQLPALYIYSRLLQNPNRTQDDILLEFARHLVSGPADQTRLAEAIRNLGLWSASTQVINNWSLDDLQPVEAAAPHAARYTAQQIGWLRSAYQGANAITTIRPSATMPMLVTPAEWIQMLRDQLRLLYGAAIMTELHASQGSTLASRRASFAALPAGMPRTEARQLADSFQRELLASPVIQSYDTYIRRFWPYSRGLNNPMGIMGDFMHQNLPLARELPFYFGGDVLRFEAPSQPPIYKAASGRAEENAGTFSFEGGEAVWEPLYAPGKYSADRARSSSSSGASATIIFSGTGISLVHSRLPLGATANWSINGGANGSGLINTVGNAESHQVVTRLASGLPNTLHTLRITRTSPQADRVLVLDAVVVDAPSRLRLEESAPTIATAGAWAFFEDPLTSDGRVLYTTQNGASATISFEGTAVALIHSRRADYGAFSWSINGGAGGSGSINQAGTSAGAFPVVLATGLPLGRHTLQLTKTSGFLVSIDAVDSSVPAEQPATSADAWLLE